MQSWLRWSKYTLDINKERSLRVSDLFFVRASEWDKFALLVNLMYICVAFAK